MSWLRSQHGCVSKIIRVGSGRQERLGRGFEQCPATAPRVGTSVGAPLGSLVGFCKKASIGAVPDVAPPMAKLALEMWKLKAEALSKLEVFPLSPQVAMVGRRAASDETTEAVPSPALRRSKGGAHTKTPMPHPEAYTLGRRRVVERDAVCLPLISRSGYFKKALIESSSDVELPHSFPGGSETFEMVALFAYDSPLPLDPFNVSALRCAAEFLQMTEDHTSRNLCETSDLYLNQVVLQSWDDTLIVLQTCQTLLPMAEELLIVSRCVESLAFMACMEILDPEQRRHRPVPTLQALAGRPWDSEAVKEVAGQDLWIKDLIALPFQFFRRIIRSLRRQGMKEKYVSPIVVFYANKWVLSKKTHKFWENTAEEDGDGTAGNKVSAILRGILELLPAANSAEIVPVTFYFALLSISLALNLHDSIGLKLQDLVAYHLHLAQAEDFLLPDNRLQNIASSPELKTMERVVSINVSSRNETTAANSSSTVAELWDMYLSRVAVDPKLGPDRFTKLIETVPMADRDTHDHLYKAINTFLSVRTPPKSIQPLPLHTAAT
ncbi:hypothetical protein BHM03_00014416 [Ensete ventricosum]|nr:hypothetical protein BHM03_00014416 [Ensete ventricosum]